MGSPSVPEEMLPNLQAIKPIKRVKAPFPPGAMSAQAMTPSAFWASLCPVSPLWEDWERQEGCLLVNLPLPNLREQADEWLDGAETFGRKMSNLQTRAFERLSRFSADVLWRKDILINQWSSTCST